MAACDNKREVRGKLSQATSPRGDVVLGTPKRTMPQNVTLMSAAIRSTTAASTSVSTNGDSFPASYGSSCSSHVVPPENGTGAGATGGDDDDRDDDDDEDDNGEEEGKDCSGSEGDGKGDGAVEERGCADGAGETSELGRRGAEDAVPVVVEAEAEAEDEATPDSVERTGRIGWQTYAGRLGSTKGNDMPVLRHVAHTMTGGGGEKGREGITRRFSGSVCVVRVVGSSVLVN